MTLPKSPPFRVHLYRTPAVFELETTTREGRTLRLYSSNSMPPQPLGLDYDKCCEALTQNERTQVELDGSFVHRDADGNQVDGMIYDLAGTVQYIELLCQAERSVWETIMTVLSDRDEEYCVQDIVRGFATSADAYAQWQWD